MYKETSLIEKYVKLLPLVVFLFAAGFAVAAGVSFLSALFVYFGFNHGVVPLAIALGGHVTGISYWASYFTCLFVSSLGALLKGSNVTANG